MATEMSTSLDGQNDERPPFSEPATTALAPDGQTTGRPVVSELTTTARLLAIDLDADDAALAAMAVREINQAALSIARAGLALLALKERLDHGQFEASLESAGITQQRASEAMRCARMLLALPAEMKRRIAALPPSKAIELARAEPEVVEQLLEEGALDGDAPLTVREIRQRLKKLAAENEKHKTDLESAKLQLQRHARASGALETEGEFPAFARAPRHEAFAFEQAAAFMLDNLSMLVAEHLLGDVRHPEANRFLPVVAANCQASLAAVEHRIRCLRQQIETAFPGCADAPLTLDHQLSAAEGGLLIDRAARMRHQLERERKRREDDRANTQVGRRGNKRGARSNLDER